ncbi:hypothetical protein [Ktedonobacter racemifer]|uniref:Uncharacterized protein n=1 Tax=Ktedonobacter racemifer DSM 44963 TaxID=485913 RepID=D6TJG7_KTERA|nr:hypothetical protein [Ktedonobacter racemifer]EFH89574.1 hypothetical protein Krac_11139 [Ktedonobacter racemifer DSM 44963]
MNPMLITYLGLIVALAILGWGGLVLLRYYHKPRTGTRQHTRKLDAWVPFNPISSSEEEYLEAIGEDKEDSSSRLHARARQNGHSQNGHYNTEHKQTR